MTRKLIAVLLVLGLAACQREASNEPESTTDVTPAEATPTDSTAATTPPAASTPTQTPAPAPAQSPADSAMASQQPTSPAPAATMGDDVVDPMATAPPTAAGGSTLGSTQTDATLEADLRRCDTMTGTERTTCRSEAQTQYDQRSLESGASVEP
jgi:hypothetical protein